MRRTWGKKNVEIVESLRELYTAYLVFQVILDTAEHGPFEVRDRKMGVQVTNRIRRNIALSSWLCSLRLDPDIGVLQYFSGV